MTPAGWTVETELTRDPAQSRVWALRRGAVRAVFKQHQSAGKFHRERAALEALAGFDWCPALIAVWPEDRALLIEHRPGAPRADAAAGRRAGEVLAALHATPVADPDPLPLADALGRRLAGWIERATGLLPPATLAAAAARFGDAAAFAGDRRVRCHRDYAPRNWLLDGARFTLIDYEHSAPDHPLVDVVRLAEERFADPAFEAAFAEGYGAPIDHDRLDRLLALHALATAAWGRRHHDAAYTRRGDRLLARLGLTP